MSDKRKCKKDSFTGERRKAWNRGKETKMPVTVTEGLAATDKVRFITNKHGLRNTLMEKYYRGEHSDSSDCFSDVESSYGESDSDSEYFEEAFKNNKEIKK